MQLRSQNIWAGWDLQWSSSPTTLQWWETSSSRSGWSEPCPAQPWKCPGVCGICCFSRQPAPVFNHPHHKRGFCSVRILSQYSSCLDQRLPKFGLLAPKATSAAVLSPCHFHGFCGALWDTGMFKELRQILVRFSVVLSNLRNTWWLHCSQLLLYKQLFNILCPEIPTSSSRETDPIAVQHHIIKGTARQVTSVVPPGVTWI